MNFLDIMFIILIIITFIATIIFIGMASAEGDFEFVIALIFGGLVVIGLEFLPFVVIDKASGSTIGTITSVDKNFFGTTALYIKTTETNEEEYCIEFDEKLENQAKELIGKKVKITYGKRVGLYSTGKCSEAPVDTIEVLED